MAEFRASHSDFERMLHLRARTFAPVTKPGDKRLILKFLSREAVAGDVAGVLRLSLKPPIED